MTPTARTAHGPTSVGPVHRLAFVTLVVLLSLASSATAARADVLLGTAESFAVLAGESVTNTGTSTIFGDIGVDPGTSVTGSTDIVLTGDIYTAGTIAAQAKADLAIAFDATQARLTTETILVDLSGQELGPGVYASTADGAFLLPVGATLTLDGGPDDVWIFKSTSTLGFETGSEVVLLGEASACNVFWVVDSSASLGANASIVGTIMARESITMGDSATLVGRALARNASVTLIANTITNEVCTTPVVEDETPVVVEEPAPQVTEVPVGPVATGGGSLAGMTGGGVALMTVLLALLIAGTVRVLARRRSSV